MSGCSRRATSESSPKKSGRLLRRQIEDLADRLAVVAHLEDVVAEARAVAGRAGDVDVGEELHLDLLVALSRAGLAASAGDVEGEGRGVEAAQARQVGGGEEVADGFEGLQVGDRIGAPRRAERRLVDEDHLLDAVGPLDVVVLARHAVELAEALAQAAVEDLLDQGRLAGAGDAGDAHQARQRNRHVDAAQVVLPRAAHRQLQSRQRRPALRHGDAVASGQVLCGHRLLRWRSSSLVRAGEDDLAAALAGAGAEVDDVVGLADDLLLVLDHDHRVLLGAQLLEDAHQALAVARVEADRGLVEDVERVDQRRADGAGEIDARQLAAGEGTRLAVERQVVEADGEQVAEPAADLAEDQVGDLLLVGARRRSLKKRAASPTLMRWTSTERLAVDAEEQRVGLQAAAFAGGAELVAAVAGEEDAHVHLVGAALRASGTSRGCRSTCPRRR